MRVVATVFLALMAASCAPRAFDLVPRETSASSLPTPRWVGTESTQSSVGASYDRFWLDHLLFEVEVVNQSDSTLVVDPEQFSLALSSSTGRPARERVRRIAPAAPARVEARIVRESNISSGIMDAVVGVMGFAVAAVLVAATLVDEDSPDLGPAPTDDRPNEWEIRRAEAARAGERLRATLLRRTALAPGEVVRGQLWFPARQLKRAIGPRVSENPDGAGSITHFAGRPEVQCAMKLRAPAALGGQELDYFVWID